MKELNNKRAVITGAGSGLGREIALKLARKNCQILVSDIIENKAEETLEMIKQENGNGLAIHCDVRNINHIENMARMAFDNWGGVDLLVNNAGVTCTGHVEKTSIENWKWVVETNIWGVLHCCHAFIPLMKQLNSGHIVNIASIAGIVSLPEMGAYNLTKAAVISLSETLRAELSPYNIGVTTVCPSMFSSNLFESLRHETDEQRQIAKYLFNTASMSSAEVAKHVLKAVKKNRLYVLPQADAKFGWISKRLFPKLYFGTISLFYRRGFKNWILKKADSHFAK